MHLAVDILRAVNLSGGALATGSAVMERMVILPALRKLPPRESYEALRAMRLSPKALRYRYFPAGILLAVLPAIAILALWSHQPRSAAILTAAGLGIWGYADYASISYWHLMEQDVHKAGTIPADYAGVLARLSRKSDVRASFFTAAFVCFAIAAVVG